MPPFAADAITRIRYDPPDPHARRDDAVELDQRDLRLGALAVARELLVFVER